MIDSILAGYFIVNSKGEIKLREDLKCRVKKLNSKAKVPVRAHSTDAGMDFFSTINDVIPPGGRRVIPTGIACAVPEGWALIMKDKSGLARNNGVHIMGGVVDSEYRGEVEIIVLNTSKERIDITEGQKIAQGLIIPVGLFDIQEVSSLENTSRGEDGFGSSGLF